MEMQRVLLVDDSETDQFLARHALLKFNPDIEVLQAYDGEEALSLLDTLEVPPDVIFLDINMPVMDGHEFLEEYSKRDEQVTVVIMLTSSDQARDRERSRAYQCVQQYLLKPLNGICLKQLRTLTST